MKWLLISCAVVELLSMTGCSGSRFPQAAASAAASDLATEDLNRLQGTWRIESSYWNGVQDPDIARRVTILFQGNQFIVVDIDGNPLQETIKLLPDQNPKAIDRTSKGSVQPAPGIYSLEGDTFKWCSAGGGNTIRPTNFSSRPGSKHSLMVLRRAKN